MKISKRNLFLASIFIFSLITISLPLYLIFFGSTIIDRWGAVSTLIIGAAIFAVLLDFRKQNPNSKEIGLVASLGVVAAVLRLPFATIPNIQPCTFLIICTGIAFGHSIGFLVGVLTPLISNLFLGHGPWTPLQMYAWGFIGAISGMLYPHSSINRWKLGAMGIISGYLYGFIMNIWFWYTYLYPANLRTFIFAELQGIPFDTLHSIGNFLFLTFFGNKLLTLFRGFKESLYINAQG